MLTTTKKKIGQRIRQARIASGFSQEDLGDALGVTRSSVSLWEKGRSFPDESNLTNLAEVLKVPQAYLETGVGKPPVRKELPDSGYRRDMMTRMQRLIATGKFDVLIGVRAEQQIMSGVYDDAVARRARALKSGKR
jgi:transcriptional regulator with XRE-family HTH domain